MITLSPPTTNINVREVALARDLSRVHYVVREDVFDGSRLRRGIRRASGPRHVPGIRSFITKLIASAGCWKFAWRSESDVFVRLL